MDGELITGNCYLVEKFVDAAVLGAHKDAAVCRSCNCDDVGAICWHSKKRFWQKMHFFVVVVRAR